MKIIKEQPATLKRHARVTVEVRPGEKLMAVRDDAYYRLGGQVEDIVRGHVIAESVPVCWCSINQQWEQ